MGPPFENGGGHSLGGGGREVESQPASMGPPFENGGGLRSSDVGQPRDLELQWGRRSKTAEGEPPNL